MTTTKYRQIHYPSKLIINQRKNLISYLLHSRSSSRISCRDVIQLQVRVCSVLKLSINESLLGAVVGEFLLLSMENSSQLKKICSKLDAYEISAPDSRKRL